MKRCILAIAVVFLCASVVLGEQPFTAETVGIPVRECTPMDLFIGGGVEPFPLKCHVFLHGTLRIDDGVGEHENRSEEDDGDGGQRSVQRPGCHTPDHLTTSSVKATSMGGRKDGINRS